MRRMYVVVAAVVGLLGAAAAPCLWDTWRVWSEVGELREAAVAVGYAVVAEDWTVGNLDGNNGCRGEVLHALRGEPVGIEDTTQFCAGPDGLGWWTPADGCRLLTPIGSSWSVEASDLGVGGAEYARLTAFATDHEATQLVRRQFALATPRWLDWRCT